MKNVVTLPQRGIGPPPACLTKEQQQAWHDIVSATPPNVLIPLDAIFMKVAAHTLASYRTSRWPGKRQVRATLQMYYIPLRTAQELMGATKMMNWMASRTLSDGRVMKCPILEDAEAMKSLVDALAALGMESGMSESEQVDALEGFTYEHMVKIVNYTAGLQYLDRAELQKKLILYAGPKIAARLLHELAENNDESLVRMNAFCYAKFLREGDDCGRVGSPYRELLRQVGG